MRFLPFTVLIYALGCWALHESDAGVVDWYKRHIGIPATRSQSTAPRFALVGGKSTILTATESNVLASLDVEDGSISARFLSPARTDLLSVLSRLEIRVRT